MRVEIYSLTNCPLCREMEHTVAKLQPRFQYQLFVTDIRLSAELFERYRYDVPLLLIDGDAVARHRIDSAELERIFTSRRVSQ